MTTTTTITADPITRWRTEAAHRRARANELGDCRAGREAFTKATVLESCADEAAAVRDQLIAVLRHRVCEQAHAASEVTAKYRRQQAFAVAGETARFLEVVLSVLGSPGDGSLPQPAGSLPLHGRADAEAREFIGLSADRLLGRNPVW